MAEFVKKGLAFASIPTDRDNFAIKLLMWNLNDKYLSRVIPEYFTKLTFFMLILASFVKSLELFLRCFSFIGSIIITFNLDKFNVNLLAINHLLIFVTSVLILVCKVFNFLSFNTRLVSSANSLGFVDEMLAISLMYKVKRKGPKTEPCGTPQLIFCLHEILLFIETY